MIHRLRKQDWLITIILSIFCVLSVSIIFSATFSAENPQQGEGSALKQIAFFLVGFAAYFLVAGIDISWLKQRGVIVAIYIFILATLVFLLAAGEVRADTQRWIFLGPFSFQPAEFSKVVVVLVSAYIFTYDYQELQVHKYTEVDARPQENKLLLKIAISGLLTLPILILVYLQPSLGNTLIIFAIWLSLVYMVIPLSGRNLLLVISLLLAVFSYYAVGPFATLYSQSYLSGFAWKAFTFLCLLTILVSFKYTLKLRPFLLMIILATFIIAGPTAEVIGNNLLKDYQRERIIAFFDPDKIANVNQTSGYQVRQSKIAVGSGQLTGSGFLQGQQSSLQNLPFAHTDFVFAALAEQFGFLGVVALFILYGLLFWRIAFVFLITKSRFGKLIVIGTMAIIAINAFINTAMNLGLMPVTGVPLPLVSYGGSSVLVIMLSLGMVQMVHTSTKATDFSEKFSWKI